MATVVISGWIAGCNTVAAIKELREKAGLPLNEALALVNRVLTEERVIVPVSSAEVAEKLSEVLLQTGLIATSEMERQEDAAR